MSNGNEEFWQSASFIMLDLIKPIRWHIRWRYQNIINTHHTPDINYCYRILFNSFDQECGNGIVEECNCSVLEK